jgi:hypothetical protein
MAPVKRNLTFVAWADALQKQPFDLGAASAALATVKAGEEVLKHGEELTAVDHVKPAKRDTDATEIQLLALHDADNAPSEWGPGEGARRISIGDGRYTAFFTHVLIWPDNVAAFDAHANAPGLGRLAEYIKERTGQRIQFRALYEQGLKEQLEDIDGLRSFEYGIHDPHKKAELGASGMVGNLLPKMWQKVPSMRVKMGMGRRGRRDAYLPPDLADDVLKITDSAEQFFDALIFRGPSKTLKQPNGRPKPIEVNLLSKRLRVEANVERDAGGGNLPDRQAVFAELRKARKALDKAGKIDAAQEARIVLDQKG